VPGAYSYYRPGVSYGGVSLDIQPYDAGVYVDGTYMGIVEDFDSTQPPLTLTAGRHHIDLESQGAQPMSFDITVVDTTAPTLTLPDNITAEATSAAGDTLAGIGEHTSDAAMMMQRAQDKIARTQAHADAVDSLLDSGVLDAPLLGGGTSSLDDQITATVVDTNVQAKLAAMKSQLGLAGPAAAAGLEAAGIVLRIHGGDQYRLDASVRPELDGFDHRLIAAVRANDDAAYHAALGDVTAFVTSKGMALPHGDLTASNIILPSDDMSLDEVTSMLQQENWMGAPAAT